MRKPGLSAETLRAHVASRFLKVSGFARIAEGEESQAFALEGDGAAYVLRVNHRADGFHKDTLAHRHFTSSQLPIPEVISIENFEGHVLCISRRVEGMTLQDLSAESAFRLGPSVAAVLDAMAGCDVSWIEGYGPFNSSGRGRFGSWSDFVGTIGNADDYDWPRFAGQLDLKMILPLLNHVVRASEDLPDIRGLVHGDFGSNNVLTSQDAITGVIDWSEAMVGDPLYDVANILFWRPHLVCMHQQIRFFEERQPWRLGKAALLQCYALRIGLDTVFQALRSGDKEDAEWALSRCLDLFGSSPADIGRHSSE